MAQQHNGKWPDWKSQCQGFDSFWQHFFLSFHYFLIKPVKSYWKKRLWITIIIFVRHSKFKHLKKKYIYNDFSKRLTLLYDNFLLKVLQIIILYIRSRRKKKHFFGFVLSIWDIITFHHLIWFLQMRILVFLTLVPTVFLKYIGFSEREKNVLCFKKIIIVIESCVFPYNSTGFTKK